MTDTADDSTLDYQGDSRFGQASTLTTLAAAALLDQLTPEQLHHVITWPEANVLERYGDHVTDVVDNEPVSNTVTTDNTAVTSTPRASTKTLKQIVSGEILDDGNRSPLIDWMTGNATGDTLIHAGAPEGWGVADQSGGAGAIRNDVAVVIPRTACR
ncbi:beta-lactamase class A [Salinibacterium sp. CAN_S4]|uniref:serine hydrolase n=1 Tax=Salinibacterium sp. CAN_S4 TaxID=2787727 RepID=UPI0018EFEE82